VNERTEWLTLAVQKAGRLSEDSLQLLAECGIALNLSGSRSGKLRVRASNFPLEVLFVRDDDIPALVNDGIVDVGIVGANLIAEKGGQYATLQRLGFSQCRLAIAVPKGFAYSGTSSLAGARIATSYPRLLSEFLTSNGIEATIHEISGSVEIAPSLGLAEAICDLVSSGSTLISNGLVEVETIFYSEALLIGRTSLDLMSAEYEGASPPALIMMEKSALLRRLVFRIGSVLKAREHKYIVLNAPVSSLEQIKALLPGMKSPTVIPLAEEGWCAVHSVVAESHFWEIIESLKEAGAQGILVVPIEKMVG